LRVDLFYFWGIRALGIRLLVHTTDYDCAFILLSIPAITSITKLNTSFISGFFDGEDISIKSICKNKKQKIK
jgi:hypothetical protein